MGKNERERRNECRNEMKKTIRKRVAQIRKDEVRTALKRIRSG